MIDKLRRVAGDRLDILAHVAGRWPEYYESVHTRRRTRSSPHKRHHARSTDRATVGRLMLTGLIRPLEIPSVDVEGDSLADIHAKLTVQVPAGWELTKAPAAMTAGSTALKATGTTKCRDGMQEIEADTMTKLEAKVPDGWQMLSVRS